MAKTTMMLSGSDQQAFEPLSDGEAHLAKAQQFLMCVPYASFGGVHKGNSIRLTISEEKVVGACRAFQVGCSPRICDRRGTNIGCQLLGSLRCLTTSPMENVDALC